jgi:hypothetical protein
MARDELDDVAWASAEGGTVMDTSVGAKAAGVSRLSENWVEGEISGLLDEVGPKNAGGPAMPPPTPGIPEENGVAEEDSAVVENGIAESSSAVVA